jgi:hypothetical protein
MASVKRWHYREIEHDDRQLVALRVFVARSLAKELGVEFAQDPLVFHGDKWTWGITVRINTDNPIPFKEILERSEQELVGYLESKNEQWLADTGRYRIK